MPLPDTLILKSSAPVWDSSSGWQTENLYEGVATEAELTSAIDDFIAGGATRIRPVKEPYKIGPTGGLEYEISLTVNWASANSTGAVGNPASPDFGLFSRTWSLTFEEEQLPILEGRLCSELAAFDAEWPVTISTAAARYRVQWSDYIKAEIAKAGSGKKPVKSTWLGLVQKAGSGTGLSGIPRNTIAAWAFNRLTNDEGAVELVDAAVLRKSEVVAPLSNVRASHLNVRRVLRYSTLLARETTLTGAVLLNVADIAKDYPFWLKKRPITDISQQGRFTITQDYVGFAEYDGIQYRAAL
jgi:hypothetical protein